LQSRKPKFQIPCFQVYTDSPGDSANSRFRASEFPGPLRGSAEGPQNPDSMFPSVQIPGYSSANSSFQDSECADSRILLGKFQIPSFRVSEYPSWVRARGTPKFQIPSFRVSEAPSLVQGRGTPKFQIPSFQDFEALLLGPSQRAALIPDSEFPSFRGASWACSWVQAERDPHFRVSE
jgi:hypothetical protein